MECDTNNGCRKTKRQKIKIHFPALKKKEQCQPRVMSFSWGGSRKDQENTIDREDGKQKG